MAKKAGTKKLTQNITRMMVLAGDHGQQKIKPWYERARRNREKSRERTRMVPMTKKPAVRRLAFGFAGSGTTAVLLADGAVIVRVGTGAGTG